MSTVTQAPAPDESPVRSERPVYKVTSWRVLRSEWSKFWSLRSTWITLGLALLFVLAFGLIAAARYASQSEAGRPVEGHFAGATAVSLALFGISFGQLALGVLGVLVTAGEYSTGTIRSTLAAVPRRLPVLWSKAAVLALVALAVGGVGAFVSYKAGSHFLSGTPVALSLSSDGVVRSLLGGGVYLALVGVIGIALGAVLRSVAGGVAVLVAVLLLIPGLVALLPSDWEQDLGPYLPSNAGESMYGLSQSSDALSPGAGLAVLLCWTLLALAGAAYRLMRSDA
ncbi:MULTISPECIES: ABC transporter permease subunit [Streptomyces]|uniref:Integral membrane protein n=1 Tax=Streptomyces zinciresistens K42 TaxID=700597 RepID=G2G603_9ACTN|nr:MULTISPECIES: ABC transporter permease subunit [Streptomyces]EGX61092.1 integral membrane protein [Streptomyces zinciresistens K42]MDT9696615.1 ABC transporter permease subunit [Streptomyces sp. P17]